MQFPPLTPLPVQCFRQRDESVEGFVLRSLEANGHRLSYAIERACGTSRSEVLAYRLGLKQAGLELSKTVPSERDAEVTWWRMRPKESGERYWHVARYRALKVCPLCIASREVRLKLWAFEDCWACPKHGIYLIDRCAECGIPAKPPNVRLAHCAKCGAAISDAKPLRADPATYALAQLIANGDERWPSALSASGGLTLDAVRCFALPPGQNVNSKSNPTDRCEIADRAARSCAVMADWPKGLVEWLEARRDTFPDRSGVERFGPWLQHLRRNLGRLDFVSEVVNDYLWTRWDGFPALLKSNSIYGAERPTHLLTPKQAGRILGVAISAVRPMVLKGELRGRTMRRGKRNFTIIECASVEEYLRKPDFAVGFDEAGARLGIGYFQVRALVRCGRLIRLPVANQPCIDSRSIDHLIEGIGNRSHPSRPEIESIRLSDIPASHLARLSEVIHQILDRELACYCVQGNGLKGFAVSVDEILGYREKEGETLCTFHRAAGLLRLRDIQITALVEAGCLRCGWANGSRRRRGIYLASIEAFHADHIGTKELADYWNTNSRSVLKRLREAQLTPLVGSDAVRHVSAVWSRREVAGRFGAEFLEPKPGGQENRYNSTLNTYRLRQKRRRCGLGYAADNRSIS